MANVCIKHEACPSLKFCSLLPELLSMWVETQLPHTDRKIPKSNKHRLQLTKQLNIGQANA